MKVFSSARLGPVTLRNRVVKAATFEGATPDGLVSPRLIAFHRAVAEGGVGMSTVAYLAVSPEGRTHREQIHLREEALPGLQRLTGAVHEAGAAIAAQIGHAGPVANGRWGMRLFGRGFLREYPYEEAFLLPLARRFRAALAMPLMLLGGINKRATLDLAMAEGFQFVAMARALLREPDLVNRMRASSADGLCIHCNRCMPTIYSGTRCVVTTAV